MVRAYLGEDQGKDWFFVCVAAAAAAAAGQPA